MYKAFLPASIRLQRWKKEDHPWIDVALIEMTTFMPCRALARTYFNLVEKPRCLRFQHAHSLDDYHSYAKLWSDIWTEFEMKHMSQMVEESRQLMTRCISQQTVRHHITICTSPLTDSGVPRVDVYIVFAGLAETKINYFYRSKVGLLSHPVG